MFASVAHKKSSQPIEWLRAFSVIVVVIYHYDKNLLAGGFLGVDIFLVISGYLVGGNILEKSRAHNLSIMGFVLRRFWRLQPALFVTLVISFLLSCWTSTPSELVGFSETAVASFFGVSNIYLWLQSGYFGGAAEYSYLLHTWSLSLEWQYYICSALIAVFIINFVKYDYFSILIGFFVLSLVLAVTLSEITHSVSFFNLPTRFWEFAAGTLIYRFKSTFSCWVVTLKIVVMLLGFTGCFASVFVIDESMVLPGNATLLPVVSAMLVLIGADISPKGFLSVLLAPFYYVGGLSYSVYLLHWPYAVAMPREFFNPTVHFFLYALVTIVSSILLKKHVEDFFNERKNRTKLIVFSFFSCVTLFFIALGVVRYYEGLPSRLDSTQSAIDASAFLVNKDRKKCLNFDAVSVEWIIDQECFGRHQGGNPAFRVFFWGDSHLETLRATYLYADQGSIQDYSFSFAGHAGCPPLDGINRKGGGSTCSSHSSYVYRNILESQYDVVVIGARFTAYIYGNTSQFGNAEGGRHQYLDVPGIPDASEADRLSLFKSRFRSQIEAISKEGMKVILVASIPEFGHNVPRYYYSDYLYSGKSEVRHDLRVDFKDVQRRTKEIDNFLADLAAQYPEVYFFDPKNSLCWEGYCNTKIGSSIVYFDDDHLNTVGASLVGKDLLRLILQVTKD